MMKKFLSVVLAVVLSVMPLGVVFASGNGWEGDTPVVGIGTPNMAGVGGTVSNVLGVIKYIGYAVAIAMVMFAGIKYLTAGVGEKAQVKSTLLPMLAGAIMVVAAVTIVNWVFGLNAAK